MKIKVLIVPSIITLAIVLGIWFIYPAYSNGSTGVKDHYDQLQAERLKLDAILGKSENAKKLSAQLNTMSSEKDTLYEFIPADMKESEIIDNLNKMASDSGLLIYSLSVNQPNLARTSIEVPQTLGSTSLDEAVPVNPSAASLATLPKAIDFETDMQISGSYSQVKNFLQKIDVFARYSDVYSMYLKKGVLTAASGASGANTDTTPLDILTVNLKINFNELKKATLSESNVGDAVFSSSSLDTKVISQIKNQYSGTALKLDIGQTGKANPFMP